MDFDKKIQPVESIALQKYKKEPSIAENEEIDNNELGLVRKNFLIISILRTNFQLEKKHTFPIKYTAFQENFWF